MNYKINEILSDKYTKIAIIITAIYCIATGITATIFNPFFNMDSSIFYYYTGKQILQGLGNEVFIPNAPLSYAVLSALTDDPFTHMKIISIFSTTGIIFFSYLIVRQIFNSKVAVLTTLFISLYAGLQSHAYQIQTDVFPMFLLFVSFYYITKRELNYKKIILVAVFLGASYSLKYPAAIIAIGFLIFFLIYTKPRFKNAILFFTVCVLVASPVLIFNYSITGEFTTSNSSSLILHEWNDVPSEWYEEQSYNDPFLVIKDMNLLFQNFSAHMYKGIFNTILNFDGNWNNLSIFPLIPYLGMVPLFGGIYFVRKSIPENLKPLIITFLIFLPIMCIFAQITNPTRLFPPALIIPIFSALFFSKIKKNYLLIPILIFIVLVNLGASGIMANWFLFENDTIYFWENKNFKDQELYDIAILLSQEEDIESKYLMADSVMVSYYANSKFIKYYTSWKSGNNIHDPILDSNLEEHITRKNWNAFDVHFSNFFSYPQINNEHTLKIKPDYLLIEPQEKIPNGWSIIYQSEKFTLYKIPK